MSISIVPIGTKVRVRPDSFYVWTGQLKPGEILETVGNFEEGIRHLCTDIDDFTVLVNGEPRYGWVGDAQVGDSSIGYDMDFEEVK